MSVTDRLGAADIGMGQPGFVARHELHSEAQRDAAARVRATITERSLRSVQIIVVDQHGVPRTKWLTIPAFHAALRNGADFSGAIYSLDTANSVFTPAFADGGGFGIAEFTGFPDIIAVPDPTTFRVLPGPRRDGWIICDPYFATGRPVPLDARHLLRLQLAEAQRLGFDLLAGLEVEFYIVAPESAELSVESTGMPPPAPRVRPIEPGYQFLSSYRQADMSQVLAALRDALLDADLPLRTIENEWGPGQIEVSFEPMTGLQAADAMVLFRAISKQVCHQLGLLATFMCWPNLPNFFPSGWHLHQSLLTRDGDNAFTDQDDVLSSTGRSYAAGLLQHAAAMTVLGTPTINGLRRFRPYSFAPDRVCWGMENRGALVRVQAVAGDPSAHLELRIGEPAANPYLYIAASLAAGLDGLRNDLKAPPMVDADPYVVDATPLPTTMEQAVTALEASRYFRASFGDGFIDYLAMMKRAEMGRYAAAVGDDERDVISDWEMNEYFEAY